MYKASVFHICFILGDHFNLNVCQGSRGTILFSLLDGVDHVVVGLLPLVLHLMVVGVYVLEILCISSYQSLLFHVEGFPFGLCIFGTNLLKISFRILVMFSNNTVHDSCHLVFVYSVNSKLSATNFTWCQVYKCSLIKFLRNPIQASDDKLL